MIRCKMLNPTRMADVRVGRSNEVVTWSVYNFLKDQGLVPETVFYVSAKQEEAGRDLFAVITYAGEKVTGDSFPRTAFYEIWTQPGTTYRLSICAERRKKFFPRARKLYLWRKK